jgi:branched-chain amino acid transport system permease protein
MFERTKLILVACVAAFTALSPFIGGMNPYYYDILLGVGISLILAVGLNLVNGYTGQFSLGHAGFMAVGAYLASAMSLGLVFPYFGAPLWTPSPEELAANPAATVAWWQYIFKALGLVFGWVVNALFSIHNVLVPVAGALPAWGKFLFALLYGGALAALTGLTVGVPSLRLKGDYLAIVTLGFNEIIKVIIQNAEPVGASRGLGGMEQQTNFFWTFSFAALTVYVVWNIVHSTYGRGFLAVRDDEIAAEAMGINTTKYKVLAFVLAAFFAGIAGGLYAHFKQFIHPEGFNFMKSVDIVVMVILGGMGSMVGVCVAAVLLTILPEVLRWVAKIEALPQWAREIAENRMIIYSLILIILMLARPQGLFAGWVKKKTRTA